MINSKEDELKNKYWDGNANKCYRYWFYLNKGTDIFNQFKYILAAIFGIYFTLKLKNPIWIIIMGSASIPILILFGYLQVHKIGKVLDWLNVKYSTHYTKYTYELMENQLNVLKEIKESMGNHSSTEDIHSNKKD